MGKLPDLDALDHGQIVVRGERRLRRIVHSQRNQTLVQITTQLNDGISRTISKRIVQRSLHRMDFKGRQPTRVSLLNVHHRAARLACGREPKDWSVENKKRVAWSDESLGWKELPFWPQRNPRGALGEIAMSPSQSRFRLLNAGGRRKI
ncbi:HTH_Tnp_Tc3_2 domain-containing protein [Trichonephila clavipes]|nr:HTH_Tnp_Tc3_2 domain-containing protein [Trichonephila clavipes]